ncbi:MAG: NAD-glutamate dehydrogenase domain-containing protein, partial [Acidobacteriota bacterium]
NLGIDVQRQPFTVCGIGDMAGDVFGNGMLQSRTTRLVAAFNHVHIFVDPDPEPEKSYDERQRLFHLPRSTWRDYDRSAISQGGGVFDRTAKAIPVSREMARLFGLSSERVSGEELVRRILTAPVDLLYNGGIGTYVKASREENADVGDRTNDRVRVDAVDVKARVVAEGGNLGFTQEARLEYWAAGGLINTDAVDNSGGVDMSDHEVNIKILLDLLLKKGLLSSKGERNRLLADMTEDVAGLVLADNERQGRALTFDGLRSAACYDEYLDLIDDLVRGGLLNRRDEQIPSREELLESPQRERGLPRPLLAVLTGYAKMWAFQALLEGSLPDSPAAHPLLVEYFPPLLRERFAGNFADHTLRREIIATVAANHVINCSGITLIPSLVKSSEKDIGEVVGAYLTAERDCEARQLRDQILKGAMSAADEQQALLELESILEMGARDLLTGRPIDAAAARVRTLRSAVRGPRG